MESTHKIELNCPVTLDRISIPTRGRNCEHLQCFDLEGYLRVMEKTAAFNMRWKCPECHLIVKPFDLVIDTFIEELLKVVSRDVCTIELDEELNYHTIHTKDVHENTDAVNENKRPSTTSLNDNTIVRTTISKHKTNIENSLIVLDSDDDNESQSISNNNEDSSTLPEVTSTNGQTSLRPADSSPPEVTTLSSTRRGASSNYLSLKGRATPGDRGGEGRGSDGSRVKDKTSSGSGLSETIYGSRGEVNREADGRNVTSGGPVADLREAKGVLNRGGCLQDKERTSSGRADGRTSGGEATTAVGKEVDVTSGGNKSITNGEIIVIDSDDEFMVPSSTRTTCDDKKKILSQLDVRYKILFSSKDQVSNRKLQNEDIKHSILTQRLNQLPRKVQVNTHNTDVLKRGLNDTNHHPSTHNKKFIHTFIIIHQIIIHLLYSEYH